VPDRDEPWLVARQAHPAFPVTIYYAFKQSETEQDGTTSTGWETFLEAVLRAGFAITGTWPMRTEGAGRMIASGTNALASSIVLVCRQRAADAQVVSRREFLRELNATLPEALAEMTRGGVNSPVAPVDLSQAIIGPGMAIFSQYAAVLEADGTPMSVRIALQLINRFFAEDDFDHDTQFKRLMADIEAGKIDIVVDYKIDRLTRSLTDFSKMIEVFERNEVSFVSVTQGNGLAACRPSVTT
jgi:putative DNA methylase